VKIAGWMVPLSNIFAGLASVLAMIAACGSSQATEQEPTAPSVERSSPDDSYAPSSDSVPQTGVPHGSTFEFTFDRSRVFPGTHRKITVYVPAQYTADKPACVYVGLDGLLFEAPVVFDNLINKREMPVTVAVGVAPGEVDSADPPRSPRFNRTVEFDGLNGDLARFVLEELLPEVEHHKTPGGLPIKLSEDPNDRAVGGISTGGVGSFTVAWQRPDAFRRVFTSVGTFVGMRGGDRYPVLVRKTEPKPIRIFMQDGSNDQWLGGPEMGDWWMSNRTLERALTFAGYQVMHVWGEGTHNSKHPTAIFPDAMRWLWKGWPQPVTAGRSQNTFLKDILVIGESWQAISNAQAEALKLDAQPERARGPQGREYFTVTAAGQVWLHRAHGKDLLLDSGLKAPTGIVVSPDGLWLAVAESGTHWGYSYRIESDGTVSNKQKYYWFHVPDDSDTSGAGGWVMDRDGRLYAATRMGVQVFDHNGRVRAILPVPAGEIKSIAFVGADRTSLLVGTSDHRFYRRKMQLPGAMASGSSTEVPDWGPG
jgi:gluconolactonase